MCYEYFCRYNECGCFHCKGIEYCKDTQQQMRKVRPIDLHRIRYEDCPSFRFFSFRCDLTICKKHLNIKLEIGGDDWNYGSDVDLIDGVDESTADDEDTIMEEQTEAEEEAEKDKQTEEYDAVVLEESEYQYQQSRKKVEQWFKRNKELEKANGGTSGISKYDKAINKQSLCRSSQRQPKAPSEQ